METTSYVLSFRIVFFYLATTNWVFYISSHVIIQSINPSTYRIPIPPLATRGTKVSESHLGVNPLRIDASPIGRLPFLLSLVFLMQKMTDEQDWPLLKFGCSQNKQTRLAQNLSSSISVCFDIAKWNYVICLYGLLPPHVVSSCVVG